MKIKIKVKNFFRQKNQVPLINPKNGQGELTTAETKFLIFELISEVDSVIICN